MVGEKSTRRRLALLLVFLGWSWSSLSVRADDAGSCCHDREGQCPLECPHHDDGQCPCHHLPIPQFSCEDVRLDQLPPIHPRTGDVTTQFERRVMLDTRIFDCFWRAFRYTKQLEQESPLAGRAD